jgi:hypothetical protein
MAILQSRAAPATGYTTTPFLYDKTNPRGFAEVVLALITTILCWILVGARFAARYRIHAIGADDILILIATPLFTVYTLSVDFMHSAVPGSTALSIQRANTYQNVRLLI